MGCRRARAGSPEKKFEVMGGRADVPRDPAMAGGAAHSIQDCTPFLAKPNQQGGRAYLPEPTLQTPCYTFLPQCQFQAITKKTSLLHILSQPSLGRAESREHSPSREHRGNVSYRLGKWECDHGLGLGFRFPVSLPHTFYMRNGFVSEIRAPQKVIMRNRLDMFSEPGNRNPINPAVVTTVAVLVSPGGFMGHIPIYSVYNSRFHAV